MPSREASLQENDLSVILSAALDHISGFHCLNWLVTVEIIDYFASFSKKAIVSILVFFHCYGPVPDCKEFTIVLCLFDHILPKVFKINVDAFHFIRSLVTILFFFIIVQELNN